MAIEWNVKKAINPDVERQHLNKILAEIRASIAELDESVNRPDQQLNIEATVGKMVEGNTESGIDVTYNPVRKVLDFAVSDFVINLTGDVTGSGTVNGLQSVSINTSIADSFGVEEAPEDGAPYWRRQGGWEYVGTNLEYLHLLQGVGFPVRSSTGQWYLRQIEVVDGELTVVNPAGQANPVLGLADVEDSGEGELLGIERDDKGRVTGTRAVTTDDLPEGDENLFFSEGLVYEALKDSLVAGPNITITPDDLDNSITISSSGGGGGGTLDGIVGGTGIEVDNTNPTLPVVALSDAVLTVVQSPNIVSIANVLPGDGDILEFNDTASLWEVTTSPRLLYLDGGNF